MDLPAPHTLPYAGETGSPAARDGGALVVAVSSRALFDLESADNLFRTHGLDAWAQYHSENEQIPLAPGPAFPLVSRLLELNGLTDGGRPVAEVILLTGQHSATAMRVLNSIKHYGLHVRRFGFTGGMPIVPYLRAFRIDLLLSRSATDVQAAVDLGIAAAHMYLLPDGYSPDDGPLRIAYDGDAVLFSEESEVIYRRHGFGVFRAHEEAKAHEPLPIGPFGRTLMILDRIRRSLPAGAMRTALITARDAPAHERVLRTLRSWDVSVDEAFFVGDLTKAEFLSALRPQLFLDDQDRHLVPASKIGSDSILMQFG